MDTVEVIRLLLGTLIILYGLGVNYYEKNHNMKYVDQINGVINGKVCIFAGVLLSSLNLQFGVIFAVGSIALWMLEEFILSKKFS